MATGFTITKVEYANTAAGLQTWTFEYKLFSDVMYTLISSTASVNTDGTLDAPLSVGSLTAGQLYLIRASANCESPREYFYQQVQT